MNVAIVGSRDINSCTCDSQAKHWPPTPEERAHAEVCPKVEVWLLILKVVTRLAGGSATIYSTDTQEGTDKLVHDAAEMLGVPFKALKLPAGRESTWERANKRNTKLVEKVDRVIAIVSPGDIRPGIVDLLQKAESQGIPTNVWKEGAWL